MNRHFLLFLSILILSTLNSCDKDKDDLKDCKVDPDCEYFRCKVNGMEWRPDCESDFLGCTHTDVQYYKDLNGGGLEMIAKNFEDSGIKILVYNISKENLEYNLLINGRPYTEYYVKKDGNNIKYILDSNYVNYILLSKLDTINYLIEGTFEFIGVNSENEIIKISEGEFRQKYRF